MAKRDPLYAAIDAMVQGAIEPLKETIKELSKPTAKERSNKIVARLEREIAALRGLVEELQRRVAELEQEPRPKRGPFDWPSVPERERPVDGKPWIKPLQPYEVDPSPYRRGSIPMVPDRRYKHPMWTGDVPPGVAPTTICENKGSP